MNRLWIRQPPVKATATLPDFGIAGLSDDQSIIRVKRGELLHAGHVLQRLVSQTLLIVHVLRDRFSLLILSVLIH